MKEIAPMTVSAKLKEITDTFVLTEQVSGSSMDQYPMMTCSGPSSPWNRPYMFFDFLEGRKTKPKKLVGSHISFIL